MDYEEGSCCGPHCPREICRMPEGGRFIDYHSEAFCGHCYNTHDSFCCQCGLPHCFVFEPATKHSPCQDCKPQRNPVCAIDHACQGGCGVRFCETEREEGVTYVPAMTRPQKALFRTQYKNHCLDCLSKIPQLEKTVLRARALDS